MATPTDENLYKKVKAEVDKTYDKPSAYRSMAYSRFYLKEFEEKYGDKKKAYKGKNPAELEGWRQEKWVDIKSFLRDPAKPVACGNEPYGKGEYPLCMPKQEAGRYSRGELELLVERKKQIGKRRLVKDAYLRDVLKPDETPPERKYKQKYIKDKKLKLPKPLPEKEAERILDEPPITKEKKTRRKTKMEETQEVTVPVVEKPKRGRGRPRLSDEEKARSKAAALERRKEKRKQESAGKAGEREEEKQRKQRERDARRQEEEDARQRAREEREADTPPVAPIRGSPEDYDEYARKKKVYIERVNQRNLATSYARNEGGQRVLSFV
jgi:hypothetical protein